MPTGCDISKFLGGLQKAGGQQLAAAVRGVDRFGEHVIGDAQELAPVLTGALKASGTTDPAVVRGSHVSKEIGFNTDYAAAVHEVLTAHHPQGQAKYLETAMRDDQSKFGAYVEKESRAAGGA